MQGNDFVKILLRSPLHSMLDGNLLLITVKGRKSGKAITAPVNYYRDGNILWVISNRERKWWRNVCCNPDVILHLRGRDVEASAEAILDEQIVSTQIGEYVKHLPMSAKPFGVRIQNETANCEDTARLAKEKLFVKIQLKA